MQQLNSTMTITITCWIKFREFKADKRLDKELAQKRGIKKMKATSNNKNL